MTTYTFVPNISKQIVAWTDSSAWSGGLVPADDPNGEVVIPQATPVSGQSFGSIIDLSTPVTVGSLNLVANALDIMASTLSATGGVTVASGGEIDLDGTISAQSFDNGGSDIQGAGGIVVSGEFVNRTLLLGEGMTVQAGTFDNLGVIETTFGGLTLEVASGGFAQLSGSALTGGRYEAIAGNLDLAIGAVIASDAANITLSSGGMIRSFDGEAYAPIAATMHEIAASGALTLIGGAYGWSDLAIDGVVTLQSGAVLSSTDLTVNAGGVVSGFGAIAGPVTDDGVIQVGSASGTIFTVGAGLMVSGAVTGSGTLDIHSTPYATDAGVGAPSHEALAGAVLELLGSDSTAIRFMDSAGKLVLDDPAAVTGAITAMAGDEIVLDALSGVISDSYAGDAEGGVLTLQTSGGAVSLAFAGNFDTNSFILADGSAGNSQPQGLSITIGEPAAPPDDFAGSGASQVLLENANGALVTGALSGGALAYGQIGALGPEWTVVAAGDFLGGAQTQFLIQNTDGAVALGQVTSGAADYTLVAGLGSGWTFAGAADFLGNGQDQFLITNGAGSYVAGNVSGGQTSYTTIAGFGPEWTVVGTGDYLGDGKDQILAERDDGALAIAEYQTTFYLPPFDHDTHYAALGSLQAGWTLEETGDFLGRGHDDLLVETTAGVLEVGEAAGGQMSFSVVGALGSEWRFVGVGDFSRSAPDSFLIQNAAGAVVMGTVVSGAAQYAQIGALGAGWSFHG